MKITSILLTVIVLTINIYGQSKFQNDKYGFEALVPADWHIYSEIKDNPSGNAAVIDWGLPKVYSDLEKKQIENGVTITAYKRNDIKNIEELIKYEHERLGTIIVSNEIIDSTPYLSYLQLTVRKEKKYKSKVEFVFKTNIGYIINFTATPGTYDLNISKFDSFVESVRFIQPKEQEKKVISNINLHLDGLYVAKTTKATDPKNNMEMYIYLRFYDDGYIYSHSVIGYSPKNVAEWLGRGGTFERKGKYTINGSEIKFIINNDEDPNKEYKGAQSDTYEGKINDNNLLLDLIFGNGKRKRFEFKFVRIE